MLLFSGEEVCFLKYTSCNKVGRWSFMGNWLHQCILKVKLFFSAGTSVETSPEEQTASCEGNCFHVLMVRNAAPLNVIFKKIIAKNLLFKNLYEPFPIFILILLL